MSAPERARVGSVDVMTCQKQTPRHTSIAHGLTFARHRQTRKVPPQVVSITPQPHIDHYDPPQPTSPVANLVRNILNTPILVLTTEIVAAQSALHSNAPAAWCPSCDPSAADIAR
ncbi:hypothetical protein B0H14DRAFT_3476897 [Mycena olivaceomarginata]|nr:hypothetical protein B0H14DRAFT_3476897 [Mycena olivaceomarginata]